MTKLRIAVAQLALLSIGSLAACGGHYLDVRGQVVDQNGAPVNGATVKVFADSSELQPKNTDGTGSFDVSFPTDNPHVTVDVYICQQGYKAFTAHYTTPDSALEHINASIQPAASPAELCH